VTAYALLQRRIADRAAARTRAAWDDGHRDDDLADAAAVIVVGASAQATALADASLARTLHALPLGLTVPDERWSIVRNATRKVVDEQAQRELGDEFDRSTGERLYRMADGMVGTAGREAYSAAMRSHGVGGWTRQLTSDNPCPLCLDLADGTVLSPDVPMVDHPGCSCTAAPVSGDAA